MPAGFPGVLPMRHDFTNDPSTRSRLVRAATFSVVRAAQLVHITRCQFRAPRSALNLLLHVNPQHAATDVHCHRHPLSPVELVHETGQRIFEDAIFGTKSHVAAAPSRPRCLTSAILCTPAARSRSMELCSTPAPIWHASTIAAVEASVRTPDACTNRMCGLV